MTVAHQSLEASCKAALATFPTENIFFSSPGKDSILGVNTSPWAARAHLCLWEWKWSWLSLVPMCWTHSSIRCGIPLWWAGVRCPGCVPSKLLVHSGSLMGRAGWGAEKPLMLYKHCSAVTKTLMCSQHRFGHKSETQPCMSCYEENIPVKTCTPLISSEEAKSELLFWYFVTKGQKMDEICR